MNVQTKPQAETGSNLAQRPAPVAATKSATYLSWNSIFADLDNSNAISWQSVIIFVPLICLASMVYDINRLGGIESEWITTAFVGYLTSLAALLVFRALINRYAQKKSLAVLVAFIVAGLLRGIVVYSVGSSLGLLPPDELAFRLVGSAFLAVWVLVGANIVVVSASRYGQALGTLKSELTYLAATKNALGKNLDSVRAQLFKRINDDLLPAVRILIAKLDSEATKKSPKFAVAAVQDLIESVVRPLSHRVMGSSYFSEVDPTSTPWGYTTFRDFFRGKVALNLVLLPSLVATVTVVTTLPSSIVTMRPHESALVAVIGWNSIFLFLSFAKFVFRNAKTSTWLAGVVSYVVPLSLGLFFNAFDLGALIGRTQLQVLQFYVMAASLSFASFWFQVLESKRHESLRRLDDITEDQRRLVSALRQEVWVLQRHLAATLHGPIQSVLFASLYRFGNSEKLEDEQIAELVENLEAAIRQLQNPTGIDGRVFAEVWQEIRDFWAGVCNVEGHFEEATIAHLSQYSKALSCLLEVIREGINNAVRHAGATDMSVEIEIQEDLVWLQILNNGKPLPDIRNNGLGSHLIDEVTHSWQLLNCEGAIDGFVTELRASVVLLSVDFVS